YTRAAPLQHALAALLLPPPRRCRRPPTACLLPLLHALPPPPRARRGALPIAPRSRRARFGTHGSSLENRSGPDTRSYHRAANGPDRPSCIFARRASFVVPAVETAQ